MAKYSFEFKKKVVVEYLQGKGGMCYLSKKYGISSTGNKVMLSRLWLGLSNERLQQHVEIKSYIPEYVTKRKLLR